MLAPRCCGIVLARMKIRTTVLILKVRPSGWPCFTEKREYWSKNRWDSMGSQNARASDGVMIRDAIRIAYVRFGAQRKTLSINTENNRGISEA